MIMELKVIHTNDNIAIFITNDISPLPIARSDIDFLGAEWHITRVYVDKKYRRMGLGTICLRVLQKIAPTYITVYPGGYFTDRKVLHKFYVHNGFIPMESTSESEYFWKGEEHTEDVCTNHVSILEDMVNMKIELGEELSSILQKLGNFIS